VVAGGACSKIGADAAQISRYENGCIGRCDCAAGRGIRRGLRLPAHRPGAPEAFPHPEDTLGEQLASLAELQDEDVELVLRFIEALVTQYPAENARWVS
jgi:hypothetical protein